MGISSVLPFLAALKKQPLPPDMGDMSQDSPLETAQFSANAPMPPPGPIAGPAFIDQAPQQPPENPLDSIAQGTIENQGAPSLRGGGLQADNGGPITETKGHKLLRILMGAGAGAAAGAGQRTFGGGFQQAQTLPLEVQRMGLQNEQVRQMLPFLRANQIAGLQKTQAETQNFAAQAQKHQAEVQGMPIKQALEKAQAEAANYKEDPNLGLIDLRTKQPVSPQGLVPIQDPDIADILGKQVGDRIPLKLYNTADEIRTRGITNVTTAEGVYERNRKSGSMTRLGSAPAVAIAMNNQITDAGALDMAANYYAQTGQLPSGFGRSPASLSAVMKRAAELHPGEDLAKNKLDYEATKRYMGTINGTQQVRLRQAITAAADSLDKLQSLYNEWQTLAPTSGFKVLNHATLLAMKNMPGRAGAVAQALDAQIADLTSELGNVYMGGNSPTDHALGLAKQNLSADWNRETFEEGLKQARLNLGIRKNSIINAQPEGLFNPPNKNGPSAEDLLKKHPPKVK